MAQKQCTVCKQHLDMSLFHRHRAKADGLQTKCKACSSTMMRAYYVRHRKKHRAWTQALREEIRKTTVEWLLDYLLSHPCVDCGETDPLVLEFDHVRGVKRYNVSVMVSNGATLRRIQEEIAKCDVRCGNCHARRTKLERNTYIVRLLKQRGFVA